MEEIFDQGVVLEVIQKSLEVLDCQSVLSGGCVKEHLADICSFSLVLLITRHRVDTFT